jgi:hypothetical protein
MVLSAGPVHKPQHRVRRLPERTAHVVLRGRCIQGLDVKRFPPVGPRETYVPIIFCSSTPKCIPIYSAGSGKSILWFVIS